MFGLSKKKKTEKPDRPKVYVTSRGGLYVKVDELLASKAGDNLKKQLAAIDARIRRKRESTPKSAADRNAVAHQRLPDG